VWLHRITVYSSALAFVLVLSGCVSTGSDGRVADGQNEYQFDPLPVPEINTQDLQPGAVNATRLLAEAKEAFDRANKAQKDGDQQTAYAQYNAMMELLLESDLDPAVFYDLRKEFSKILQETTKYARLHESTPRRIPAEEVGRLALRSQLEYPDPINDRVLTEIRHIQSSYPKGFQAGLDRSSKYLPYIREEFRKAGLPQDLVWLAMVESQFTPRINSRVGAGGMWQFMPSTGRRYGLDRDHYIDQRYDWKKSTHAAIQYLSELYEMFDESWPLAVSAYNMGEGGVERAIARNGGQRDLWQLLETPPASTRIPRETKKFYAKLLASAIVAGNPERYGFSLSPGALVDTKVIQVTGAYMISDIEKAGGLPAGTLQTLNTQFLYGYTPPNRTTELYVPVDKLARVQSSLADLPKLRPDTHVVSRGETLSGIASMYEVSSRDLMRINSISSPRRLQINQRLVIPGRMGSSDAVMATNAPGRKVYSVRKGDSLSKIASRNGISVSNLQRWNLMGDQTRIHIGDRLYVSKPVTVTASAPKSGPFESTRNVSPIGTPSSYTVKSGDYLDRIAKDHGVTLESLLKWNNLTLSSTIRVGDKLRLYNAREVVPAESATGSVRTHTIKRGENPGVIARQYGVRVSDLLRWNGLTKSTIVHIGDVLYVQAPSSTNAATASAPKSAAKEIIHVVKRGENPGAIARKYKVALNDLYAWNGLPKNPVIRVGQKLKIKQ
jgi:membrane-bound lytic murein transglycosylase D